MREHASEIEGPGVKQSPPGESGVTATIPPWTILAGLGSLSRQETCELLALFEDARLLRIALSRVRDLARRQRDGYVDSVTTNSFNARLRERAAALCSSDDPHTSLTLRLWNDMREALGLTHGLPLSTRTANQRAAEVAQATTQALADTLREADQTDGFLTRTGGWLKRAAGWQRDEPPAFADVVGAQMLHVLAEADRKGLLDEPTRAQLAARLRARLEDLPAELRDGNIREALASGDQAMLKVLAAGGPLVGLGIGVELAGFGAYILAAKASAVIPLLGGQTAVSALFVLAHPLFILPAVLGGGWLIGNRAESAMRRRLAATLACMAAMRGLEKGRDGLKHCLDSFRAIPASDLARTSAENTRRRVRVEGLRGQALPETPGHPPGRLARGPDGRTVDLLKVSLFPERGNAAVDAAIVGSLTLGDIVYHAAAIDPKVIEAADFSRAEDLGGIFEFGVFADRMHAMTGMAAEGAGYNLKGYVAEQIVAARLVENGHQVELPDVSNEPGYDLLVDGAAFQVKCLSGIEGLREHFATWPEIPVLANAELAGLAEHFDPAWADRVFFVEGYDGALADDLLNQSLAAASQLNDLDTTFLVAAAVSAARNIHGWWRGQLSLSDLPLEVLLDGSLRTGLVVTGGFTGQALGLLVFGPAGAVIFGATGGIGALLGAGRIRTAAEEYLVREWRERVERSADLFEGALRATILRKREILQRKLASLASDGRAETRWLSQRLEDDALALAEALVALDELPQGRNPLGRVRSLLGIMHDAAVHPWTVKSELDALIEAVNAKPSLADLARQARDGILEKAPGRHGPGHDGPDTTTS